MERPQCDKAGSDIGLFGMERQQTDCNVKLRRKWKHIGWYVLKKKMWLSHMEVSEYLKQYNANIDDIPDVAEGDK